MSYTNGLDKPVNFHQTETWSSQDTSIDTINFAPDWVWIKSRTNADTQVIFDTVRGANKRLSSSGSGAEPTTSDELTAFNSDGYTLGTGSNVNRSGHNYISWNWLAGGTASSNTDGSITSSVSANTTAGFSIVSYTGNGSNSTIGHGLGAVPRWIIVKVRDATNNWVVQHGSLGATKRMLLDTTNSSASASTFFNNTEPTSSVFTVGTEDITNNSGNDFIAYCFAEKQGYSKFGSYTGNGSTEGTYIHLGFKAAYIMIKGTGSGTNWFIQDNKRNPYNIVDKYFNADSTAADQSADMFDITANGIKQRNTFANLNGSGSTYIYMAFAESPFVSSGGIPTTAR